MWGIERPIGLVDVELVECAKGLESHTRIRVDVIGDGICAIAHGVAHVKHIEHRPLQRVVPIYEGEIARFRVQLRPSWQSHR